jgi:hypothetical protein
LCRACRPGCLRSASSSTPRTRCSISATRSPRPRSDSLP